MSYAFSMCNPWSFCEYFQISKKVDEIMIERNQSPSAATVLWKFPIKSWSVIPALNRLKHIQASACIAKINRRLILISGKDQTKIQLVLLSPIEVLNNRSVKRFHWYSYC